MSQLTSQEITQIARRAQWYIEASAMYLFQDSVVFTGDGVDDLDRVIAFMGSNGWPVPKYMIDTGSQYSVWKVCDIEDVQGIRAAYIEFYGTVNKPNLLDKPQVSFQNRATAFPND